jgi:Uma2 family endonuclease
MSIATGVSLEEYLHTVYEPDCDYVDGVLEDRNVGQKRHSRTQKRSILILSPLVEPHGLEALPEQRVQVSKTCVRVPDVCVVRRTDEEVEHDPPELCIEILSPDDRWKRLHRCINDYLAFGVPVIWILDPYDREAFMATQENKDPHKVFELRWNDVVIQLGEIFPE